MRKILAWILALVMVCGLMACGAEETPSGTEETPSDGDLTVSWAGMAALVTDSENQTVYEAMKTWCEANGFDHGDFQPAARTAAGRTDAVKQAVEAGSTVIFLVGSPYGEVIAAAAEEYPDVIFLGLDVSAEDLGEQALPDNAFCASYQEELAGFMAGYATVRLGYRHVGFLGSEATSGNLRYGYGYVQGLEAAAVELGAEDDVKIEFAFAGQPDGDGDIIAVMDEWYGTKGVEVVFACGGTVYTCAAEAAAKTGGKVIGAGTDQAALIDGAYGEGMTLTTAEKGLARTVAVMLDEVRAGKFSAYGGQTRTLGLVSAVPGENFVGLSEATRFSEDFTGEDYAAMVGALYSGGIPVSDAVDVIPLVSYIVNDYGNLK